MATTAMLPDHTGRAISQEAADGVLPTLHGERAGPANLDPLFGWAPNGRQGRKREATNAG